MSRQRIIILIVALLVLGVIAYFIVISIKPRTIVPPTDPTEKPGLADLLGDILGADWWKNLFKKDEPVVGQCKDVLSFLAPGFCHPTKCGYTAQNVADVNCGHL